jgi:hypothetical protein
VDPPALMSGSVQADLAEAIRAVHEERPETSAPTIAAYSNEAGRVSRSYVGHTFQLDRGHRSNLIAAR